MRRTMSFLMLAASAAGPLSAQAWNPQDQRPPRDDRGVQRGPDQRGPDQRGPDGPGRGDRDDGRGDPRAARPDGRPGDRRGPDARPDRSPDGRGPDGREWRGDDRGNRPGYPGRPGQPGGYRGGGYPGGGWQGGDGRGDGPGQRQDWGQRQNDAGRGRWNSGWRDDRRYDWQGYRAGNRALYRAPRYYGPRGYDYNRWSRGYRVEPYFYGRNYWINDPYRYRLPPAYGDYRWVRYYDDVALIDIRTGLIEDIIYGFFYR